MSLEHLLNFKIMKGIKNWVLRIFAKIIIKKLKLKIMKDWKTTIAGAILAALVAIQPIVESGNVDWTAVIFAALIAAFGYLVRDKKGTVKKPK